MALVRCIECGYEISDKSDKCIKCGCPTELSLPRNEEYTCLINGQPVDLSEFFPLLIDPDMTVAKMRVINEKVRQKTRLAASFGLCRTIMETKKVPKEYNGETLEEMRAKESRRVHCPRCGSTNVEERKFLPLPCASYQKYRYCRNCHNSFDYRM